MWHTMQLLIPLIPSYPWPYHYLPREVKTLRQRDGGNDGNDMYTNAGDEDIRHAKKQDGETSKQEIQSLDT